MMVVKAPQAAKIAPGLLEQTYSAEASTGGKQAAKQPALVGQKDESIILYSASTSEPWMALGQPVPTLIIGLELELRSSPA